MSSFDLWPFEDVRSVGRRGELEILAGTAPDGAAVTITRVAPDAASDAGVRQRFADAVEATTRHAGADDPPVLWADTSTLVPWAATYDDSAGRGADLIGWMFSSGPPPASRPAQPSAGLPPQYQSGEKSVPALDASDTPATYHTDPREYGRTGEYPAHPSLPPAPQPAPPATSPSAPPPSAPPPPPPPGMPDASHPAGPPGPSGPKRTPLYVALGAAGLVVVLLLGIGISYGLTRDREPLAEPGTAPPSTSASPTQSVQFSPGPSSSSSSPSPTPTTPKPTLEDRKAVSVYGPTWQQDDETYTMDFAHLGWAFRAPGDFDCLVVEDTKKKTRVNCLKLGAKKDEERRVLIKDLKCSGKSCGAAERKKCETDIWGDRPEMERKDEHTKYLTGTFKHKKNKEKYFGEYMGYYYNDDKGNRNRCVLVYGDAPVGKYAKQIQKTVNDIRTQAS